MYNVSKMQKALDKLEMGFKYGDIDYYYPRYQKLLSFCIKNNINVRA